jgi:DNA-binding NtrC family response regulator
MKPLYILLLGQDPARRDEMLQLFRTAGHQATAFSDPASAAEALGAAGFDTLVLDLSSPELGLMALRQALGPEADPEPDSLDAAERRHLALVLRHTAGNKRKAAHLLGISRSTLLNKVRKYSLEPASSRK